jgi:hypothetical protein
MSEVMKPCPCAGEPMKRTCSATEFDEDFYVSCAKCGLRTKDYCFPHLAAEAWNAIPRTPDLATDEGEVERVARAIEPDAFDALGGQLSSALGEAARRKARDAISAMAHRG